MEALLTPTRLSLSLHCVTRADGHGWKDALKPKLAGPLNEMSLLLLVLCSILSLLSAQSELVILVSTTITIVITCLLLPEPCQELRRDQAGLGSELRL